MTFRNESGTSDKVHVNPENVGSFLMKTCSTAICSLVYTKTGINKNRILPYSGMVRQTVGRHDEWIERYNK